MPIITALEVQKKNKDRVNVFVDDKFFCGLTLDAVVRDRLSVGMNIGEADLSALQNKSEETDFFTRALNYVLKSPKTEKQVRDYLYRKQCASGTIHHVIDRLKALNYINDANYAQMFTESKQTKLGVRAIKNKLYARGIASDTVNAAAIEIAGQTELVHALAAKYMRNRDSDTKTIAKLFRFLAAKGFDYDDIQTAINLSKNK